MKITTTYTLLVDLHFASSHHSLFQVIRSKITQHSSKSHKIRWWKVSFIQPTFRWDEPLLLGWHKCGELRYQLNNVSLLVWAQMECHPRDVGVHECQGLIVSLCFPVTLQLVWAMRHTEAFSHFARMDRISMKANILGHGEIGKLSLKLLIKLHRNTHNVIYVAVILKERDESRQHMVKIYTQYPLQD